MAANTSKFIRFPNGARCRPHMIGGVNPTETGVMVTTSNGDILSFILARDEEQQIRVIDLLADCCDAGKKFVQPDWSFLDDDLRFEINV
jgi:hypothetical protein